MEESLQYNYLDKIWTPCPTAADGDCFFHSAFGTRDEDGQPYQDKYAKSRRMYWVTFLTYHINEVMAGTLVELLKRCLNANDKYLHKRVDNPDDPYAEYIKDIAVSDYWVMVEEIPLLAALHNTRIVLFIDNREQPEIFKPDPEILGNFPFRSILPEREVVIRLVNNHFSRLRPYVESTARNIYSLMENANLIQDQEVNRQEVNGNPYFNRQKTYEKRGSAGISGGLYQVNLLTMVLLNGLKKVAEWRLSSENRNAAKFDDLIFEYLPTKTAILLQAKHKQNIRSKITYNDLISTNSRSEFSLPMYFISYQQVKRQFKIQNVVLCTDVGFDENTTRGILIKENTSPESVLYFEGSDNICYSFKRSGFPDLKYQIIEYSRGYNNRNEAEISDEDIDAYLKDLRFFPNCLGKDIVDKVIEETLSTMPLSENLDSKTVFKDIHKKMIDWFKEDRGRYLSQVEARAFFCDIRSSKYCENLNQHYISFEQQNLPLIFRKQLEEESPIRIEHIIPEKEYILNVVKVYQALPTEHKSNTLFVNPDEAIEIQKQIIEAFVVPHYTILVIVCPKTIDAVIALEMREKLMEIINYYKYKRVILIADETNNLAAQIKTVSGNCYKAVIDNIQFTDLAIYTQEEFKYKRNINFQGITMSLQEIFRPSTNEVLNQLVNSNVLVKLSRDEIINVGLELRHLDHYYIDRKFKRNGRIIPEQNIYHSSEISDEKIILISDTAGMGKSTVLASLALSIKSKSPHLWVVRFDLKSYTNVMEKILTQGGKSISIAQLLDSQETTKLKSEFEKKLFATRGRVVMLLDGVDEVSPTYTELVKNLIKESLNQINLAKIFVTSRPNPCKDFEITFRTKSFKLMPFTDDDQIDFLTKYWIKKLNLQEHIKQEKCVKYAKCLIQKMSVWLGEQYGNTFDGIPRQTRMIAELFQEKIQISDGDLGNWQGCKEFVSSEVDQPELPEELNLIQLYETFISEKRSKFIDEKFDTSRKTAADAALEDEIEIEKYLELHRSLSLFSEHFRL